MDTNETTEVVETDDVTYEDAQPSFASELGKSVAITAATSVASVVVMIGTAAAAGKAMEFIEKRRAKKAAKLESNTPENETD